MNTGTDSFAVFILTHGRPNNITTLRTLDRQGYTGPVYLVVDNEDADLPEYRRLHGDKVIVFDKAAVAARIDEGDNFRDRRAVIYARNACFDIARDLGIEYFLELDDDYKEIQHKFTATLAYGHWRLVTDLDRLFATVLRYYVSTPAVTIAMAQGGDFIGGGASGAAEKLWLKRKAMNSFFCSVHRPFTFFGRINEDVHTYVTLGNRGALFLTFFSNTIEQHDTQQVAGGMSDLYAEQGTYRKSFYTVMYAPFCVTIRQVGIHHPRIHHRISWRDAVPCILRETTRKALPQYPGIE